MPQSRVIPISDLGQISLTFKGLAANVLEMTTVPRLGPGWATKMSLTMVDPIVQPVRVTLNPSDQSTSFRLPNIQRLRVGYAIWLVFYTNFSLNLRKSILVRRFLKNVNEKLTIPMSRHTLFVDP